MLLIIAIWLLVFTLLYMHVYEDDGERGFQSWLLFVTVVSAMIVVISVGAVVRWLHGFYKRYKQQG